MLRSDLCDYSDAYIVEKETIDLLLQMRFIKLKKVLPLKIKLHLDKKKKKLTLH